MHAPADAGAGLAARLLTRVFFRAATLLDNRVLTQGMHLLTLEGPALRGVPWVPGDKLQIQVGPGLQTRTYTPIDWDTTAGRTRILGHALAPGPGSEWVRRAAPGQAVSLLGPRRSLALAGIGVDRGLLVGDETAIGLAAAWRPLRVLLEIGNPPAIQPLLDTLGLRATVVASQADERHLEALAEEARALAAPDLHVVLVGRARTVKQLRRALRAHGVASQRLLTKAYWADGKTGLD